MIKIAIDVSALNKKSAEIKKAVERAMEKAAGKICENAASLAPVKTGRLRGGMKTEKTSETRISVGNSVPYAFYVEFGTSRAAPNSFLRSAAVSGAEILREDLINEIKEVI